MSRAVFLDRDGVLNAAVIRAGKPYPPQSVSELEITPGAAGLLGRLRGEGFLLIVVTNQPDVSRGKQTREAVEAINAALRAALPVDEIYTCYHDNSDACGCRKPAPGMLLSAAERFGIDLSQSFMVGDRWSDVEAGQRAGCRTIFLDSGYDERRPALAPDLTARSLAEGVEWIFGQSPARSARDKSSIPDTEPIS